MFKYSESTSNVDVISFFLQYLVERLLSYGWSQTTKLFVKMAQTEAPNELKNDLKRVESSYSRLDGDWFVQELNRPSPINN